MLDHDAESGAAIEPDVIYCYVFERGPVSQKTGQIGVELCGKTLLDMAADDYVDPVTLQQSKALMRALINHYLGEESLHTRQILKDLLEL